MFVKRLLRTVAAVALLTSACSYATSDMDCHALTGFEPWLILHTEDYGAECVSLGVHQDLQIWNKGTETLSLEWQGAAIDIPSDDFYATGALGGSVDPGVYAIVSAPYTSPDLSVVDPDDSFSAGTDLTMSGFGPIEVGMTLEEASVASGQTVRVDADLAPGPECWHAVIEGDPYSPIFTVAGDGTEASVIEFVTTFYPSDEAATVGSNTASVPSLCE